MTAITCPDCGGRNLYADSTCHTWPGGNRDDGSIVWMACQGCGSAMEYTCEDCDWYYRHGMNPANPRAAANTTKRPSWIEDDSFRDALVDGWEWPEGSWLARPIGWVDPEDGGDG